MSHSDHVSLLPCLARASDAAPGVAETEASAGDALRHHRDAQYATDAAADDVWKAHGAQTHLLLRWRGQATAECCPQAVRSCGGPEDLMFIDAV